MKTRWLFRAGCWLSTDTNVSAGLADDLAAILDTYPYQTYLTNAVCTATFPHRNRQYTNFKVGTTNDYITIYGIAEIGGWPDRTATGSKRRANHDLIQDLIQDEHSTYGKIVVHPTTWPGIEYRYHLRRNDELALRVGVPANWSNASLEALVGIIGMAGIADIYRTTVMTGEDDVPNISDPYRVTFIDLVTGEGGSVITKYSNITTVTTLLDEYDITVTAVEELP